MTTGRPCGTTNDATSADTLRVSETKRPGHDPEEAPTTPDFGRLWLCIICPAGRDVHRVTCSCLPLCFIPMASVRGLSHCVGPSGAGERAVMDLFPKNLRNVCENAEKLAKASDRRRQLGHRKLNHSPRSWLPHVSILPHMPSAPP